MSDQRYRMMICAAIIFVLDAFYTIYHGLFGIINFSPWFVAMCIFYGILAAIRLAAVLCEYKKQDAASEDTEKFVMKLSGVLLAVLSFVLAVVNYISLSQNIVTKYEEVIMIAIATYTFYKITMAIIRAVRQRRNLSPLLVTLRSITYAEAAASLLTLQRSMLVSLGEINGKQICLMNAVTGAAVCMFVLRVGISMIENSVRKEKMMKKSKLIKANEKIAKKVVGTYKKIEDTVVGSYSKIEDAFVDRYLIKEGETIEEAKKRLHRENMESQSVQTQKKE